MDIRASDWDEAFTRCEELLHGVIERDGKQFRVSAEVNLGSRTVMEYLLSPVQKVTHEAGREM